MILNEQQQKWSNVISEELHITDQNKLNWMSQLATIHEIKEGLQSGASIDGGIYSTPLNTMGLGNPMMPNGLGYNNGGKGTGIGNTGSDFHNPNYQVGSGDIPMSTLAMSLDIAACTIGFELVPVIPVNGPWAMLSYLDFPYGGGKLGRLNETAMDGKGDGADNKPIYIKFNPTYASGKSKKDLAKGDTITISGGTYALVGTYIDCSRIDNNVIIKVVSAKNGNENCSIADVFSNATAVTVTGKEGIFAAVTAGSMRPELVNGMADHVQGFSNFYDGSDDPMTRAQNETGVGNTIGARMFTKMVQIGSYEVTGSVTRQQLQDMPIYGIDVVGQILEQMQNEISQAINNRILDRVFKLGVTNYEVQREYQNVDLNLYMAGSESQSKDLNQFSAWSKYVKIDGTQPASRTIKNSLLNTSAENLVTNQRRIMSRVLAAANLIDVVSRRGRASWVVTNTQVLTALQDSSSFIVAPMANTLSQTGEGSLYFAGSIAGLQLYVDPYMPWDDTRVCVGRKSDGKTPGVVFMPYILADTIQTVVEGTMAPKLLVNSRFAIVDAGFYPEQNYYTFMIDTNGIGLI